MPDRNWIASWIKKVTFSNGGSVYNIRVKVSELEKIANEEGWATVTLTERKTPSESGSTHALYEDTYKKDENTSSQQTNEDPYAGQETPW
tara:strand:- start:411 stop:680 length:270 start_codon:yes stop_codon:yes gene_type:complete